MNDAQQKVFQCMNEKIEGLEEGLARLTERRHQPTSEGDLYNGMLKHTVQFEITHMEHLRDELVRVLEQNKAEKS